MILVMKGAGQAAFCTFVQYPRTLTWIMRRTLRIRIAFEPNRLGAELMRDAYEWVVPVSRRSIQRVGAEVDRVDEPTVSKSRAEGAS